MIELLARLSSTVARALPPLAVGVAVCGCAGTVASLSPADRTGSIVATAIAEQRDGSCGGLQAARVKAAADRKAAEASEATELATPAPTLSMALLRAVGPAGSGTKAYDEVGRLDARIAALDQEIAARGCAAATPAATAGTAAGDAPPKTPARSKKS